MWYTQYELSTWEDIQKHAAREYRDDVNGNLRWVFRGEYFCRVPRTKLEAAFGLYSITDAARKRKCEKWIIREFQRKASLYMASEPHKDDLLEWLAVMQHHGALTRLVDFTYSFFIALYFALAQNAAGTMWAIDIANNSAPITKKIRERDLDLRKLNALRRRLSPMNDILGIRAEAEKLYDLAVVCYLMKYALPSVYPVSPFRLNRRLTAQQGLFLASGDTGVSFEENLKAYFDNDEAKMKGCVHKVNLIGGKAKRRDIIYRLKQMNISNESLFQDLDGFARSTQDYLAYPDLSGA